VGIFTFVTVLNAPRTEAVAGVNQQLNFQGRLLNSQGAAVADGFYNLQFKIYQDGTGLVAGNPGGTLKWTESRLNTAGNGVQVKNGYMSVQLGSVTPFGTSVDWNQDTLWLSINIGNTNTTCTPFTSCGGDGEMTPMKRLSSTPYALNSSMLEGKKAADFLQVAQGVQTDVSTNTPSIFINKTGSGNFLQYQLGGADAFSVTGAGDILFGNNANHTISIADSTAGTVGRSLTIAAGSAGTGGAAAAGGTLQLQGGNAAGTGNSNGGDVTIAGGNSVGTGYKGIVNISASAYSAGTNTVCAANCTISQALVDTNGTIIVGSSTTGINITLPAPSNAPAGRLVYITTPSVSTDFTLLANSGANAINITMRQNTTATMIWNGTAWTPGGASNAITLQATYNNGNNPAAVPEIKLDSVHGTIDIQDADTSIGADILNIRGSNASGLGTVLFGVSDSGRVTIQGTTDQSSAFRVLNSADEYQLNVNSANGYFIANTTQSVANQITNPGFEAGGSISGGESGWFGSTQASFLNGASSARTGNYSLRVIPNGTNMDFYAGSYREVTVGESYHLSGYVKGISVGTGAAGVQITWYDKDKAVISYSTQYNSSVTTSYTNYSVSAIAPTDAVYAKISTTIRSSATNGTFYFDDISFISNSESAPFTYKNTVNSTTAFRIQSAGATNTLFTANTTSNLLEVGDSTGSDTNTTLLVLDSATTDPTTLANKDGGLFYNSATNSLKVVVGGSVVDVCTTAVTCSGYSAAAGSSIQLQSSSPGSQQVGHFNISGTGMLTRLQTMDSALGSSSTLTIKSGNAGGSGTSGNLVLDVGTGGSGPGTIQIGHAGVSATMAGTLAIQGNNSLSLGATSAATGSIAFNNSIGPNKVTLRGPNANPISSPTNGGTASDYTLTFPTQMGDSGTCLKTNATGEMYFQNCGVGANVNLQDVYNNSSSPAAITTSDAKDLRFIASNTATDPNIIMDLLCVTTCGSNGRFAVQNAGVDVFTVNPNGGNIQVGSGTTNSTLSLLQLDSYTGDATAENIAKTCTTALNQGALYYNTTMGSLRGCINGEWSDISNPDTLGLLTFGVIPSSGGISNAYDLPALSQAGVSGPCRVSWASTTTVTIQACIAYSGGRRVNVSYSASFSVAALTNINFWGHICLSGVNGTPELRASNTENGNLPTWSIANPILCLADIRMTTSGAAQIDAIYDTRTFSSTIKEPVNTSAAVSLGMLTDAGTTGAMVPAVSASQKLYGTVIVADSATPTSAGAPNAIISTVGPAWVKSTAGSAGSFVISGLTAGYAITNTTIPNNSFYYSAGNTRTAYTAGGVNAACSAANACSGSLYINFVVR